MPQSNQDDSKHFNSIVADLVMYLADQSREAKDYYFKPRTHLIGERGIWLESHLYELGKVT